MTPELGTTPSRAQRVGLRCNGSAARGVGHVMRCLSLADELRARGVDVVFVGSITGVPWVLADLSRRGLDMVGAPDTPDALAGLASGLELDAVVLDGYDLDRGCGAALRRSGIRVLSIIDGTFGAGQEADVFLDQNLGAVPRHVEPADAQFLAGIRYALFRDDVLRHRDARAASTHRPSDDAPDVLVVFGGTDALGAAPVGAGLVIATGLPVRITAVAARPALGAELAALPLGDGQSLSVIEPTPDLPALAASCDLAVSASGSSVWELLCLGVPAAVMTVAANQRETFEHMVSTRSVTGLGDIGELRDVAARAEGVQKLRRLLSSPAERDEISERGRSLVDGRGRERVVDALLSPTDLGIGAGLTDIVDRS